MTTGTAVLCSTTELCALLLYPCLFSFRICPTSFFSKKTPPVGLEPTTLRLKAARSTDWARKALTYPFFFSFSPFFLSVFSQKGLRRESNPGHPHPKRVFYHLTTKPWYYSVLLFIMLLPGLYFFSLTITISISMTITMCFYFLFICYSYFYPICFLLVRYSTCTLFYFILLVRYSTCTLFFLSIYLSKKGFAGNRTRATRTQSGYFTT